ncbi:hypothetical protein AMJ39_05030 [candidate division TA06 bacterium DG_24]|uniref:Right handed beta helix domain-containing protein n=3 Tax=Bacteria division TA06 TaxID=1156500 RepID=A0A0S8JNQ0_UNCT6|nr:MAG: hypothetical protein AMJ39_05030 [candidate division TA06 bacterium DG_24]KPK68318.1 MAG: hypothetical protein AMJ82_08530 [candidate division TA06 bacterium SM23_40]KPL11380.1 MAG: hypothetical protein AMJ71_01035 [candidate division TA06 bacterium SM1_40]
MRVTTLGLLAVALLFPLIANTTVIHVPGDQPTIQAGLDVAVFGDTVLVAPGRYIENIIWPDVDGIKLIGDGRESTIIDGNHVASVIRFETHDIITNATVVEGFTITNGNALPPWPESEGGGIFLFYADPILRNLAIRENFADDFGGGVYSWGSYPILSHVLIADNEAISRGGFVGDRGSPTLDHVTVAGNTPGGLYFGEQSSGSLENCIVSSNYLYGIELVSGMYSATVISIAWSDIDDQVWLIGNSYVNWLGVNIDEDPLFALEEEQDYRLLWESPCIDAGDPSILDPDDTRTDMGTYFFDQDDYLTLYLTPDQPEVSPGGILGVTYTAINRWAQSEPFWVLTEATLPNGNPRNVLGPIPYMLPANTTVQQHIGHNVPLAAPAAMYGYRSRIGVPPSTLYDEDSFAFRVVEP